jgi:hypothetical protein
MAVLHSRISFAIAGSNLATNPLSCFSGVIDTIFHKVSRLGQLRPRSTEPTKRRLRPRSAVRPADRYGDDARTTCPAAIAVSEDVPKGRPASEGHYRRASRRAAIPVPVQTIADTE